MSASPLTPVRPLSEALVDLASAARAAGLDTDAAVAEGQSLAAAIAESGKGAAADWSAATGREGTQTFFDAASRGRRWRASPTALLGQLVVDGSSHALPYAEALAGVCVSASGLGQSDPRIVGNASVAASAQLAALSRTDAPVLTPRLGLFAQHLGLRSNIGSTLDLPMGDTWTPGAFPGLGHPAPQPGDVLNQPTVDQPTEGQAAAPPPGTPPAAAAPEPEPKTLEELLAELDALTGLTEVKAEIHRQVAILRVEKLRTQAGLRSPTITRHLVFVGNPGTGKTTVARLVGGIYRALGLLSKGQLVEVDRSELVAGYLGQTAIKTAEVIASAVGGVLFIDEAYSLAGDSYGIEAVDTLVKEMEDKRDDLVLIVAGYPDPMVVFIAQNPGLSSRFRTTIEFDDYADAELVQIFEGLAASADYDLNDGCRERFAMMLATTPRGPTFGNGRFARNLLEAAIGRHAWRLRNVAEPTLTELRELVADDLDSSADAPDHVDDASPDEDPGEEQS